MNKADIKELFKELEAEKRGETKTTFSFRIDKKDLDLFKELCEAKGHAAGAVIEKLIKRFNEIEKISP